jgi:hypothetical protein
MKADRYNKDKPKLSLIGLDCLEPCARVLEFGAKKYSRDNWRKGLPVTEIIDSLLRHLSALQRGELIDPESGEGHIGHIQCNALFLGNKANTWDIEMVTDSHRLEDDKIHNTKLTQEELTSIEYTPVSFKEHDSYVYALETTEDFTKPKEITKKTSKFVPLCPPTRYKNASKAD